MEWQSIILPAFSWLQGSPLLRYGVPFAAGCRSLATCWSVPSSCSLSQIQRASLFSDSWWYKHEPKKKQNWNKNYCFPTLSSSVPHLGPKKKQKYVSLRKDIINYCFWNFVFTWTVSYQLVIISFCCFQHSFEGQRERKHISKKYRCTLAVLRRMHSMSTNSKRKSKTPSPTSWHSTQSSSQTGPSVWFVTHLPHQPLWESMG